LLGYHIEAEGWKTEFEIVGMASVALSRLLANRTKLVSARTELWNAITGLQQAFALAVNVPARCRWIYIDESTIQGHTYEWLDTELSEDLDRMMLEGDPTFVYYCRKLAHLILSYKVSELAAAAERQFAKPYLDHLNAPAKTLNKGLVADAGQASTIKAVTAAVTNFLSSDLDLNLNDELMIRSFIACYFPAISPDDIRTIAAQIIALRREVGVLGPEHHIDFLEKLEAVNSSRQLTPSMERLEATAATLREGLWARLEPLVTQLAAKHSAAVHGLLVPKTYGTKNVAQSN
jgi:hypothetical protein